MWHHLITAHSRTSGRITCFVFIFIIGSVESYFTCTVSHDLHHESWKGTFSLICCLSLEKLNDLSKVIYLVDLKFKPKPVHLQRSLDLILTPLRSGINICWRNEWRHGQRAARIPHKNKRQTAPPDKVTAQESWEGKQRAFAFYKMKY